MLLKVKRKF